MRSLSTIPPDINTYPVIISSLTTYERHAYALTRPNPTPSTSLLQVSLSRRTRRVQGLSTQPPWLSRSKLGEPDAPVPENPQPLSTESTSTGRWSFWGRKQVDKPLVTSGGGILEVKQTPSPTTPTAPTRQSMEVRSISSKPASIASRSSSPAPPPLPSIPAAVSTDDMGHAAPSGMVDSTSSNSVVPQPPPMQSQPSAVSRFFGRLSRKLPNQPGPTKGEVDAKDLELSADDFSYLSEVPSMSSPTLGAGSDVNDLLSVESGRTEQMASLESMLASKPANLPSALAPPPRGPTAPTYSRSTSTTSNGSAFVAKTKEPERKANGMDLLGGLDFGSESDSVPAPAQNDTSSNAQTSMWDDFLAPAKPTAPQKPQGISQPVMQASGAAAPDGPSRSLALSPPITASAPRPTRPASTVPMDPPHVAQAKALPPSLHTTRPSTSAPDEFDDFNDFGTPQKAFAPGSTFDDFGDFSSTDDQAPTQSIASSSGRPNIGNMHNGGNVAVTQTQTRRLDHTRTTSLVSGASAMGGQRWPAPLSPVASVLSPPPRKADSAGATNSGQTLGFPFLSPPPPPPSRRSGTPKMDLMGGDTSETSAPPSRPPQTVSQPQSNMAGSLGSPMANLAPTPKAVSGSKGGLSAQDLSFFDSL